ncbi:hypothetical protein FJT64_012508 [Amphibalanus amphitrite]|uniref:Chitin-binding type-2 domain-containing protein n=1 Tax=Amphibalanus amphitrite TaxID=1232801 RepID=A0A6A4V7K5_AMPAM|nr:hypothetical protein FJT64_012508 [Amphibalanus amphitrite]
MISRLALCTLALLAAIQVSSQDTLYRGQIPKRAGRPPRPQVEDPSAYDNYVSPDGGPVALPLVAGLPPVGPPLAHGALPPPPPLPIRTYQPKPFVPRERKQVQKLQPAGPVLYTAPEGKLHEPRYGSGIDIQDLSKIPGYPGKDYPVLAYVPETKFTCDSVPHRPGLYADVETGCQAYHICEEDNRHGYTGANFLCTNGTIFNQYELTCDWWYNVNCADSVNLYEVNLDPYKNPYLTTPEKEAEKAARQAQPYV